MVFPSSTLAPGLPQELMVACRRWGIPLSRFVLVVKVQSQSLWLFTPEIQTETRNWRRAYVCRKRWRISTSRFGVGQEKDSHRTPLGLHRVACKVGGGFPLGTVFRNRRAVGLTWQGQGNASIAHRLLWLEGLEPGLNRGGTVDTLARYIYIHGVGDETTLGRPASRGCVHVAAGDLLPWYDRLPTGTLVWIAWR